jgi:hypothetical protein
MPVPEAHVSCIRRDTNADPDFSIDMIGGVNSEGARWTRTLAAAIAHIELGEYTFYTVAPGVTRARVYVAQRGNRKYLTTVPDGTTRNNLLSLPQCP